MFDPKTRILVVDDMGTMRKIVSKICRELGFKDIIEAADGNMAWKALCESNPPVGIVISDWNMPNCSGLDFLKQVRGDKRFSNLPFLLVTAEAEQQQIMQALSSGVSGYVVKPFSAETLKARLESVHQKIVGTAKAS